MRWRSLRWQAWCDNIGRGTPRSPLGWSSMSMGQLVLWSMSECGGLRVFGLKNGDLLAISVTRSERALEVPEFATISFTP